jgi:hypothetical protein
MEKWLILLSVFKNYLNTEMKNIWWSWATDISLLIFKLMSLGAVGFCVWAVYSYLRGYSVEAVAAIQMSGILLGAVVIAILLFLLTKKIIKKYLRNRVNNVYGQLFDLSNDLYQDVENIKHVGVSVFKKNPLLMSSTLLGGAYLLYVLFNKQDRKVESNHQAKNLK